MTKRTKIDPDELARLLQTDISQREIADYFGCSPSTISKNIKKLQAQGYDISPKVTGRKSGKRNSIKRPFIRELYDLLSKEDDF